MGNFKYNLLLDGLFERRDLEEIWIIGCKLSLSFIGFCWNFYIVASSFVIFCCGLMWLASQPDVVLSWSCSVMFRWNLVFHQVTNHGLMSLLQKRSLKDPHTSSWEFWTSMRAQSVWTYFPTSFEPQCEHGNSWGGCPDPT